MTVHEYARREAMVEPAQSAQLLELADRLVKQAIVLVTIAKSLHAREEEN